MDVVCGRVAVETSRKSMHLFVFLFISLFYTFLYGLGLSYGVTYAISARVVLWVFGDIPVLHIIFISLHFLHWHIYLKVVPFPFLYSLPVTGGADWGFFLLLSGILWALLGFSIAHKSDLSYLDLMSCLISNALYHVKKVRATWVSYGLRVGVASCLMKSTVL